MSKGLRVFGHPLHAALSHVPMGLLGTALLWDAVGAWRGEASWWAVSYWSVAAGLAAACVAACAGAVDYAAIGEGDPALDTGSRHLAFVLCALLPYVLGMFARGGPEGPKGKAVLAVLLLDGAGALLLSVGGWYGGHLVFHHGVGTDGVSKEQFNKEGRASDVSTDRYVRGGGRTTGA
ncbi:MAG: DUF2231 domain-containing protein [Acidobacteria bacterium]|nr:DUF2231 domain-containing protein [Acidobacteriota bacterium]